MKAKIFLVTAIVSCVGLIAAGAATGAVQVDGRMVDRPVVLKAQGILERARR